MSPFLASLPEPLRSEARRCLAAVAAVGPSLQAVLERPGMPSLVLGQPGLPALLSTGDRAALAEAPPGSSVFERASTPRSVAVRLGPGAWRCGADGLVTDALACLLPPDLASAALASPAAPPPPGVRFAPDPAGASSPPRPLSPPPLEPGVEVPAATVVLQPVPFCGASAVFLCWGAVASALPELTVPFAHAALAALWRAELEAELAAA